MVIHERADVPEETGRNDTHTSESETREVDVFVALGVGNLAGSDNHLVCCLVIPNAGNHPDFLKEGSPGKDNSFANVGFVRDIEFEGHGPTDVVDGVGDEFADEDIVVDTVTDTATNHTDGESQGSNGSDEILRCVSEDKITCKTRYIRQGR